MLIINELSTNSAKYAFKETKKDKIIYKSIKLIDEETCEFIFKDNGCGIKDIKKIKRSLGSTIVESLVNQISGELERNVENGAEFKITFPINQEYMDIIKKRCIYMSNGKILIVEDESIIALDLKYGLEDLGYEVIDTVNNGQDAIDIAAEYLPDVVLMDIKLKGEIDGIEASNIISELGIPSVYLTANTDQETFERSNMKGSYGFISKPYNLEKLNKTLKIAIAKSKMESSKINEAHGFTK